MLELQTVDDERIYSSLKNRNDFASKREHRVHFLARLAANRTLKKAAMNRIDLLSVNSRGNTLLSSIESF